jgi:hypothetical protein
MLEQRQTSGAFEKVSCQASAKAKVQLPRAAAMMTTTSIPLHPYLNIDL